MEDKKLGIYQTLIKAGYTQQQLGTPSEFSSKLDNPINRNGIYQTLLKLGYNESQLGDFPKFESKLMGNSSDGSVANAIPAIDMKPTRIYSSVGMGEMDGFSSLGERKSNKITNAKTGNDVANDPTSAVWGGTKNFGAGILKSAKTLGLGIVNWMSQTPNPYDVAGINGGAGDPIAERNRKELSKEIFKFDKEVDNYIDKLIPVDEKWKSNFITGDLPYAVASTVLFAGFGMASAAAGGSALLSTAIAGALMESESMGTEAYDKSKNVETARLASMIGIPLGATEAFGLRRYFRILNKVSKGTFTQMVKTGFAEGLEEWLQEGGQEILENITAGSILKYDKDRTWDEGVFRGAGAGFGSGFLMAFIGHGINSRRRLDAEKSKISSIAPNAISKDIIKERIILDAEQQTSNLPLLDETIEVELGKKKDIPMVKKVYSSNVLDNAQNTIEQFALKNLKGVNLNSQVQSTFDKSNTKDEYNSNVELQLGFDKKQMEQFNNLLNESDTGIRDAIFKVNPELLNDKNYLNDRIFEAIQNPIEFENKYNIPVPKNLQVSYLFNLSEFLNQQGVLDKQEMNNYERPKVSETDQVSTPFEKTVRSTSTAIENDQNNDWGSIFFQQNDNSKEQSVIKAKELSLELVKETQPYLDKMKEIELLDKESKDLPLLQQELIDIENNYWTENQSKLIEQPIIQQDKVIISQSYGSIVKVALQPQGEAIVGKTGKMPIQPVNVVPTVAIDIQKGIPVKDLINKLENQGIVDPSIAHFTKWAVDYAGNPKTYFRSNTTVLSNGEMLLDRPGYYVRKNSTNKHYIGINSDFSTDNPMDLYRTVSHETTHAAIQQGLKENRQFRIEVNELMNDFQRTLKNENRYNPNFNQAFLNESEFIAYTMSNTGGFTDIMKNTPIKNSIHSDFLSRLKSLIMKFFRNVLSLKDATYYRGVELILNRHLGYKSQEQYMFGNDIVEKNDGLFDKIDASIDKSFQITNNDMMDARVISATAQLLGQEKGLAIKDYYKYIKTFPYKSFEKALLENDVWNSRAKFFYDKNYSKDMTLEKYKDKVIKNLYNLAMTMDKIPVVKMIVTQDIVGGELGTSIAVQEYPDVYTDKNGNTKVSMHEHLKLFDLMPELGQLFNTQLTPMIVDQIETRNYKDGMYQGNEFQSIPSMHLEGKNRLFEKRFAAQGYIYLGNWSDKKTMVILKPKESIDPEIVKQIGDNYHAKKLVLAEQLLRNGYKVEGKVIEGLGSKVDGLLKNNGTLEKVLEVLNNPLLDYIQDDRSQGKIIRMVLEDLKLGGRIVDGKLVPSLYDYNRPDTYDALKMLKRPNLVGLTQYVHQDPIEVKNLLKNLPLKNHGMNWTDKGLITQAVVVNVEKLGDETITVDGKEYNLKELLINTLGTTRLDGPVFYVKGGLDIMWDELHGTVKRGVKKGWIGNSFTDDTFRNPFFVKGAFHMLPTTGPLAEWMQENNITQLITSSTAKINTYPVAQFMGKDIEKFKFPIPFSEIQRDGEKAGVKDGAIGIAQIFTSNFMAKGNKSFVDKGWQLAKNDIINYNIRNFTNTVSDINYAKVIEHLKDQALDGTSEEAKSVAGVLIETIMRDEDIQYRNLKNDLINATPEQKKLINQQLQILNGKLKVISEQLGNQYGNWFQEPFFAKGLKSYLSKALDDVINMKVPSSHLTLSPDMGILTPGRIEAIREHSKELFIKQKKQLYKEMKPYITARDNFQAADKQFKNEKDETRKVNILDARNMFEKDLSQFEDVTDQYENELENYFDENGNVNLRKDVTKLAIDKQLSAIIDEYGHLRDGYIMISKDVADEYGIKVGDNSATNVTPSSNGMSASEQTIIAILNEDLLEPGTIIFNSEYIQSILGKDYDIDTALFIPKSSAFSDEGWQGFTSTLRESYAKHRIDVPKFFKDHVNSSADEKYAYSNESKIDLLTKGKNHFEESDFKDGTLFDPLSQGFEILEKFNKQIGIPVNLRKVQTFGTNINLKSKVSNQIINFNHPDRFASYMKLDALTHHMVDMPTNTGGFHYNYDPILGFDLVHGTNLYQQLKEANNPSQQYVVKNTYWGIKNFEEFLFDYAIKLNADFNLDNRQLGRDYEDDLKYISEQKDINTLLAKGNHAALIEVYKKYQVTELTKLNEKQRTNGLSVAREYLKNISFDDLNNAPMNQLINSIPLQSIPNITTSEQDYLLTQGNIIASIMNDPKFAQYRTMYDNLSKDPNIEKVINRIPKSGTIIEGLNIDSNHLVAKMFFLTYSNPKLHELKAKVLSLIYPVDQSTKMKSQVKALTENTVGVYYDNIFQKINEYTYPLLFDALLKNRSYKFKGNTNTVSIGIAKLHRMDNNQLAIEYDKNYWNAQKLVDDKTILGQTAKNYIKKQLVAEPIARYNLSSLLSLGGSNTGLSEREQLAIDLIDNELQNYKPIERATFWMSMLGKPDAQPKYPLNLVSPKKSTTANYHSQKILLHILGKVKDDVAHRFLGLYGSQFNDNYVGRTIKEVQNTSRLIQENILDNDVEVFFQNPEVKPIVKEVVNHKDGPLKSFRMIYDIINSEKKVDYSKTYDGSVGSMINLMNGEMEDINVLDVSNSITAYQTRMAIDINYEAIALTHSEKILATLSELADRERTADNTIRSLVKQYRKETIKFTDNPKKWLKSEQEAFTKITNIIESNPLKISEILKTDDGYSILVDGKKYLSSEKSFEAIELWAKGYEGGLFDNLLNEKKLGHDKFLYKVALEYIKRTGVDNIQTLRNMQSYIVNLTNKLSDDFGSLDIIQSIAGKYDNLIIRFEKVGLTYFPRIVHSNDMKSIIEKLKHDEAKKEIEDRVKKAWQQKENGLKPNEKYLVTDDKIPELIDDYLNDINSKIVKNQYGDYIYAFQMRRDIQKLTDGLYVKNTSLPQEEHSRMFNKMLMTDLYKLNYLLYEHNAAKSGRSQKTLNLMHAWTALSARSNQFMTEKIPLSKVQKDDRIQFYYDGNHINGFFNSQDDKYIYLRYDNDLYHEEILSNIQKFRDEHDRIIRIPKKTISENQLLTLKGLYQEGYTEKYPDRSMNNQQANDEILSGLERKLDNVDTWGRYRKDRIYVREYENGVSVNRIGVERNLIKPPSELVIAGNEVIKNFKAITRGAFLGGTAGARTNLTDAHYMLTQDLGFPRYIGTLPKALYYYGKFMVKKHENELVDFKKDLVSMRELMEGNESDPTEKEMRKYASSIAAKVLLESGVTKPIGEFGKQIYNEDTDLTHAKGLLKIVGKGILATSGVVTSIREFAEQNIRITAAYMYAHKAIFRDGLTDQKEIEGVIKHGIGRTQGLYDSTYRKLGEATTLGSFGMQFSHYNTWMLKQKVMEFQQWSRLGRPIQLQDFMVKTIRDKNGNSHTTFPWRNSIDPTMESKWVFDFWYNTIGRTFELIFPGLRAGDPVGRVLNLFIYTLAQIASGGWNSNDDGWDAQDMIFSIMSFWLGLGYTLPIQAVYNWISKSKRGIIPTNNRVTNQISDILDLNNGNSYQNYSIADATYTSAKSERAWTGMNVIFPAARKFSSPVAQKIQGKGLFGKPIEMIEQSPSIVAPVLNMFKYHK